MGIVQNYWDHWGTRLRSDFERVRASHTDSAVKGAGNEQIVAEFLRTNMAPRRVVTNCTLIDSYDGQSDEVDVAICNQDQPFFDTSSGEMLIVEGVDAVVQVKARLTGNEIERFVRNCIQTKKLFRQFSSEDRAMSKLEDVEWHLKRVPYIGFAFESALSVDKAVTRLRQECAEVTLEHQPDALFVLQEDTYINVRNNDGKMRVVEQTEGFRAVAGMGSSLTAMMWCLHTIVPRFQRWTHPLVHYVQPKERGQESPDSEAEEGGR